MAAGLISEDEFLNFTKHLLSINARNRDTWELRNSAFDPKEVYLYKRVSVVERCDQVSTGGLSESAGGSEAASNMTMEEEADDGCLLSGTDNSTLPGSDKSTAATDNPSVTAPVTLVYEYHILYSRSYNTPVLYFNVYKADGSLLRLEEVWERVPGVYRERLQQDPWTFLTQQEHPILGRPYFQLHPCHTADLMKQVMGLAPPGQHSNYLISWLSAVGPVVGLNLPLTFAQTTSDDPP